MKVESVTAPVRVLVVKLSSLGDVVHTLPAAMDIQAYFPNAQIDWVVEPSFAPIVKACSAVHRVIACDLRHWRKNMWSQDTRLAFGHRDQRRQHHFSGSPNGFVCARCVVARARWNDCV